MADPQAKKSPILEKAKELEAMGLPGLSEADNQSTIANVAKIKKTSSDKLYDPKDVEKPSDTGRELPVSKENARYVYMGEYQVVSSRDAQHILGTNGLYSCVGIAVHNPSTTVTGLTHVYASSTLSSVAQMLEEVAQGAEKGKCIEVHLAAGGGPGNPKLANIIRLIEADPRFEIKSQDVGGEGRGVSLGINAKTGQTTLKPDISEERYDFGKRMNDKEVGGKIRNFELLGRLRSLIKVPEDQFLHPVLEKTRGMQSLLGGFIPIRESIVLNDANPNFDATGPGPSHGGLRPVTSLRAEGPRGV